MMEEMDDMLLLDDEKIVSELKDRISEASELSSEDDEPEK